MQNKDREFEARRAARRAARRLGLSKSAEELLFKEYTDNVVDAIAWCIVNKLGINMCAVKDIVVHRQDDDQLTDISIIFIPGDPNE